MSVRSLNRRLAELRRAGQGEEVGRIVLIAPDDWPEATRDAYDAACAAGDTDRQADIIEAQTGERPVFPKQCAGVSHHHRLDISVIEIRYAQGGPR